MAFLFLFGVVLKSMQNGTKIRARTAKSEKINDETERGLILSSLGCTVLSDEPLRKKNTVIT